MPRTAKNYQFERAQSTQALRTCQHPKCNFFETNLMGLEAHISLACELHVRVFQSELLI